jgi:hypothetical protein
MPDSERQLDLRVRAVDEASNVFGRISENYEKALKQLRQTGGRRGVLGETAELFEGKGALAGLSLIGNEVREAANKMKELNHEFHEGKKTQAEMIEGMAEGAPIFGAWVTAGRTIREMLDGTAEETATIEEENKRINELISFRLKEVKEEYEAHEAILKTIVKINAERVLLNAGPQDRPGLAVEQGLTADRTSIEEEKKKAEKSLNDKYAASIAAAQDASTKAARDSATTREKYSGTGDPYGNPFSTSGDSEKEARTAIAAADANVAAKAQAAGNLVRQRNEAIAAAKKDLDDKLAAQENLAGDKLNDIREKQGVAAAAESERASARTAAVQSEARQAELRNAGQSYQAELEGLRQSHAEKTAEIDRAAREAAEKDPESSRNIEARKKQALAAESARNDAAVTKAGIDQREKLEQIDSQIAAGRLKALEAQAAAGDNSHALELEQARIQEQYLQRSKELLALEREGNLQGEQKLAVDKQIAGLAAQETAEKREAAAKHTQAAQDTLDSTKEAILRQQAAMGSKPAEVALKRAEIAKEFEVQADKLNAIINDKSVTNAMKHKASADLKSLQDVAAQSMLRAGASHQEMTGLFTAAGAQGRSSTGGGAGITGVAAASAERAGFASHQLPAAVSEEEKNQGKTLADMNKTLAALLAAAIKKTPGRSIFGG